MHEYHDLLREVLQYGEQKGDRTGTGTISLFGKMVTYDLEGGRLPLVTTKKVNWKAALKELLWFISGSTNINDLDSKIWNEWATDDGELGPVYGKQWTDWNGVNQLDYVIDTIKNNPTSRRIILEGWNVSDLPDESLSPQENVKNGKMALPPCHKTYQFNVVGNKLDLMMYIRSSDLFLGNPFNTIQGALLVNMICGVIDDINPGKLTVVMGDAHIYNNHIEQVKEQLSRDIRSTPILLLSKGYKKVTSIYDYELDDFNITNYDPHPAIKGDVSV